MRWNSHDRINHLKAGNILIIGGRLSQREDRAPTVICESIEPNPKNLYKKASSAEKSYILKTEKVNSKTEVRAKILVDLFPGTIPLYIQYNGSDERILLGKVLLNNETEKELKCIGFNMFICDSEKLWWTDGWK